ncbi:FBP domain-containing protein [Planosporangium flavigriseum]|uniref:Elongation factor G-binding protein C-terminal treble-clef zinc-finger domain-containing protein n=1 Tax=Planosporangium flavigriseum TaxID=373681 RepID=A0A8J3LML5_9ACTN|nr:FBP domain-containing protein [Planosporangium flavigriseum]NJC66617.1 FBP domain-containing protein [Planosporangium flavigriseum]GIG73490.1 hypothetical protein Pfl04_18940 [Planosporangium flavigriseum]
MQPLTGDEIRRSFVNVSRSQLRTMALPAGLPEMDWDVLDFLGWCDPKAPLRAYIVVPRAGGPVGVELRAPTTTLAKRLNTLCNICHCSQPGDAMRLFVARRAGAAGRREDTLGTYICADLACSRYIRGLLPLEGAHSSVPLEERIAGLRRRMEAFVDRVFE